MCPVRRQQKPYFIQLFKCTLYELTITALGQRGLDNDVMLELVTEPLARGAEGKQILERGEGQDPGQPDLEGQSVGRIRLLPN